MDPFLLRLALSFVLGGLAVAVFTTLAETRGSRLGGLLLSFPVKVVIALAFIGLNEGAAFAAKAAFSVPAGLGVNVVFLAAAAFLVRRFPPWPALAGALAAWAVAALAVVLLPPTGAVSSLVLWAGPTFLALFLLSRLPGLRHDRRPAAAAKARFGWAGLLSRAAGAGAVVAASVLLARVAGPVLGGLAAVFPSGWITSMVILTRHHGPDFTGATVRVMVWASAAPTVFGLVAGLAMARWGVLAGVVGGLVAAAATSAGVAAWLRRRDRAA